ncbi:MAG: WecB/TagA/CpsF family glycosyltransferase, partial [Verrucomicrobia bacterium]|nr:WecB/TagA/CpsF family glycosyltransferase [Verrucomicrobiota bacterium]
MEATEAVSRANVLGVGVSAINLAQGADLVIRAVKQRRKGYVAVTGVHGVSEAQSDPELREILNRAYLNTPDGMPMSWVGRAQGFKQMDRVYGPDLMLEVCRRSADGSIRHFLYGGREGVAESLKIALERRFPGLHICGTYTPPFRSLTTGEKQLLIERLGRLRADICWVGLSTPKQEKFMAATMATLPVTLMIGVGAAFDLISGTVRQAPYWMQRSGLEWLFRLAMEPSRLWKRYLINNPLFIFR